MQDGAERTTEKFYDKKWRSPSVKELFENIDEVLAQIPESEHYNLYYTAGKCLEMTGRKIETQHVLPIDIDGLDLDRIAEYIPVVLDLFNLEYEQTGIVATGNGLQFLIGIDQPIDNEDYFDNHRKYYKGMVSKINTALECKKLKGHADSSVFSPARLLRLPKTKNDKTKKGLGIKDATLIQSNIEYVPFDIVEQSGVPIVSFEDFMAPELMTRLPDPDAENVQAGCDFLKWCKDNQADVIEPQWYAMLSIIARLPDGNELSHLYSKDHPQYNRRVTDLKIEQAVTASGPRTCANIETLWDGCQTCPNYQKCTSPIALTGKEHVKSAATGFYKVVVKDGQVTTGKPDYDGLMQWFEHTHKFVSMGQSSMVYVFNGTHWEHYSVAKINQFAEAHFDPKPSAQMCSEFRQKILRNNVVDEEYFYNGNHGKINFENGVYDIQSKTVVDHSTDFKFQYVLPFMYNPTAEAPRFDTFMDDISCKDESIKTLLIEYMAYTLAGIDSSFLAKALILHGEGSNGKSVFLDLLQHLAGKGNFSNVSLGHDLNKVENRYALDGKLFNATEETPNNAMMENTVFKAVVGGGTIQARRLYSDAYSFQCNAKVILACNRLPKNFDSSFGMYRRLLIVPFNATFSNRSASYDPDIRNKLYEESSGIFNQVLLSLYPLLERKRFSESQAVEDQVSEYREESDSDIKFWWGENVIASNSDTKIPVGTFYRIFCEDARELGFKPMDIRKFGKRLREFVDKDRFVRSRVDGKVHRCLTGYIVPQRDGDF